MIMCSLHYGHPGRDAMLAMVGEIWWPRIHREVIDQARLCDQCLEAGKNLKCIQSQKERGKIPKAKQQNEEIALDFAGPFQNAREGNKYLLVSIDHFSGWPDAKFLRCPTTKKVIEFLKHYIAQFGVPKKIRAISLRYNISQPIERGECKVNTKAGDDAKAINEISPQESISPEVKQIMREFPELFKRKGRVKNYEIKIDMKNNAKISQQKGRRIPIQLQEQVDKQIEKLLKTAISKK